MRQAHVVVHVDFKPPGFGTHLVQFSLRARDSPAAPVEYRQRQSQRRSQQPAAIGFVFVVDAKLDVADQAVATRHPEHILETHDGLACGEQIEAAVLRQPLQCGELVLCRHRQWQSRRNGPTVLLVGQPQQFVEYGARL